MRRPEFRTTRVRKVCHGIDVFLEYFFVKYVVVPLCIAVPFSFLFSVLTNPKLYEPATGVLGSNVINHAKGHPLLLIIAFSVATALVKALRSGITQLAKPNSQIDRDELVALVASFYELVQIRNKAYLSKTPEALRNKWSSKKVLTETSNPKQQLVLLTYAVRGLFEYFSNNHVSFRTGLMRIKDNKPVGWLTFEPQEHPPRTTLATLSEPSSAIMRAIQHGKLVVVSDIKRELQKKQLDSRRCVLGSTEENKNGSLLTYPIYCANTGNVIYVLSVLGDKATCLSEAESDRYNWILEQFGTRIILEHHLMLMMEAVR